MMKRRDFLRVALLGGAVATVFPAALSGRENRQGRGKGSGKSGFTLWQLPSQVDTIGNSYVLVTDTGRVVVMDGGVKAEELFLRGFIGALGGEVDAWFVSHPHEDHVGALTLILEQPKDVRIHRVYHSRFSDKKIDSEPGSDQDARRFYEALDRSGVGAVDVREPGLTLGFGGMNVKILGVTNEELAMNPYNNSSMILRVWDRGKSVVFLGDAGVECGGKVLNGPYAGELDCDYLQMAHHGQQGCDEDFYRTVRFRACLWPTPSWVWNNDNGGGINSNNLKTFDTRRWMDELGIREHHVSWQGIAKIG